MYIYLDIETIPAQDPSVREEIANGITAPGQYKKKESIDEWLAANKEQATEEEWRKTSLDGAYGHICCIGVAIGDADPVSFWGHAEGDIIELFYQYLIRNYDPSRMTRPVFVGHNLVGFDLRFLFQRSVICGNNPPMFIPFQAKPWDSTVFDTMAAWAGQRGFVTLDKLCKVFGIDAKGSEIGEEIDGSKVWDFVKAGRIADVAKYCEGDVRRTRDVHRRIAFL